MFQVKLGGEWKDYTVEEDRILKRAFKAGFPNAKYSLRGQHYEYNFEERYQKNLDSGKKRDIRPPHGWRQPKASLPAGRTMTIRVPKGGKVSVMKVPHPDDKSVYFSVNVPPGAKPGQEMFVPIPNLEDVKAAAGGGGGAPSGEPSAAPAPAKGGSGWSTGAKVAAGVGGAAVIGAGAVAGVMIAEHGVDGAAEIVGDFAGDAGEAIGDAAGDVGEAVGEWGAEAGEFIVDAADSAGDFIMDLF